MRQCTSSRASPRWIVKLASDVRGEGFEDVQEREVEELLVSHQEELTQEDLEELISSSEERDEEVVMVPKLRIRSESGRSAEPYPTECVEKVVPLL